LARRAAQQGCDGVRDAREALVLAVYRHDVQQLAELAPALLERRIDPSSDAEKRISRLLDIVIDGLRDQPTA
jgi:hypothetical protein